MAMHETGQGFWNEANHAGCLRAEGENRPSRPSNVIATPMVVRRLTPTECERLQGFPDDWTKYKQMVELEGNEWVKVELMQEQADGPRYRQLGNAVTVNVAKWIGLQLRKQHIEFSDNQSPVHKNTEKKELIK